MSQLARVLGCLGLAMTLGLWACGEPDGVGGRTALWVVYPAGEEAAEAQAQRIYGYLEEMHLEATLVAATPEDIQGRLEAPTLAWALVVDGEGLGVGEPAWEPARLEPHDDRFALESVRVGAGKNAYDGQEGALVVTMSGRSQLGRAYAGYEALRRLGARFYHPEAPYIPELSQELAFQRVQVPTVLGPGPIYVPDFEHRHWTFHGAHPLEHMEAFSDGRFPIDEAERVNEWIIANRGDIWRGPGRGVAPPEAIAQRRAELEEMRQRKGLRRPIGITLHNIQQGVVADVDPSREVPVKAQIEAHVKAAFAEVPDAYAFTIHFGPTELTTTPDLETVEWINWAAEAAFREKPGVRVIVNDHTTGSQPVDHFDDLGCPPGTNDRGVSDYYDLAFHVDPRVAARVHTVMFHPLEGPAEVYQQLSFAHKLCLMQKASEQGRPLSYFPESAYWLSWDNAVPVYLPLYMWTRFRDVELVTPLLENRGGTLFEHRLFNSGQEWGYWQADYAVGLLHWNVEIGFEAILGELGDPLCEVDALEQACEAKSVFISALEETIAVQREAFLTEEDFLGRPGGLYLYFAGEDAGDVMGAEAGLEFRPVRPSFRAVMSLSAAERQRFREGDLRRLEELAAHFDTLAKRLSAVQSQVPALGLPWFNEVLDGFENNALRAEHTYHLYAAALLLADGPGIPDEVDTHLNAARQALDAAETVIRRREAEYRYPPEQVHGGGLTPETALANGTTFPYRIHTKTHHLSYWTSRQGQMEDLRAEAEGSSNRLRIWPVFAPLSEPLQILWPEAFEGQVTPGDGAELSGREATHHYAEAGVYAVEGQWLAHDAWQQLSGWIVRSEQVAAIPQGGFTLLEPDHDLARGVLGSLLPRLVVGEAGGLFAILAEPAGPDTGHFTAVETFNLTREGGGFVTEPGPMRLPIADPGSGEVAAVVTIEAAQFEAEAWGEPLMLTGQMSVVDLTDTLVNLAGFDEKGAVEMLATVLGFDPDAPPETVPMRAELSPSPLE